MDYSLTRPCAKCPFRKDIQPYLTADRVQQIWDGLDRSTFPCHETVERDEDGERVLSNPKEKFCAGALILCEREDHGGQMMRIAERIGLYDARKLDMSSPVFESIEDMIDAQSR